MRSLLSFSILILLITSSPSAMADDVDDSINNLKDSNSSIRAAAADVLGNSGNSRAVDPLIQALRDDVERSENPQLLLSAISVTQKP